MYLLLVFIAGLLLANQSPINVTLSGYVNSPFLASFISFLIGSLFLFSICFIVVDDINFANISSFPPYVWFGGILGVMYLTSNILLFPKIGSIEAMVLPITGQIITSIFIDFYGLFSAPIVSLTTIKVFGVLLLLVGVYFIAISQNLNNNNNKNTNKHLFILRIWAVIMGCASATQIAVNSHLGILLGSSVASAIISFITGLIVLFIFVSFKEGKKILGIFNKKPLWTYFGGILGALFVLILIVVVPQIGTGLSVASALIGSVIGSALVAHFGLWRSKQNPIKKQQLLGIFLMIIAVFMIKLN